jgi:hypothetical protein
MANAMPSARSARQVRWRQRVRDGVAVYAVEIDARVLDMLVRSNWLSDGDSSDREAVGRALTAFLRDCAENSRDASTPVGGASW